MSTGIPSNQAAALSQTATMSSTSSAASAADLGIESQDIKTAPGVDLDKRKTVLVGSVLDLFAGKPTLKKLQLWTDGATFSDPLAKAEGRKQFEAQWYGLKAAFSEIERLHAEVKDAGNPILLDLKTRYKVKGLRIEKIIDSVVKIHTDAKGERVTAVEDRWNGNIPDGAFAKAFRNLNAVTVPAFVSVPKSEAEEERKK